MSIKTEHHINESPLVGQPKKKMTLVLKDKSVTRSKLSDEVWEDIEEMVVLDGDKYFLRKVDKDGNPIYIPIDEGEWEDRKEYKHNEYDEDKMCWVNSDVWHLGVRWRCEEHQPVMDHGVAVYNEPKWNSPYWKPIEGDFRYTLNLISTKGTSFRIGEVNTDVISYLCFGSIDIAADVPASNWKWTRCEERNWHDGHPVYTPEDEVWNAHHQYMKQITLTNADMPNSWSYTNRMIFTLTVELNDGKDIVYINNSLIAS